MPLNEMVRESLRQALNVVERHDVGSARLADDADRLWDRVQSFIAMNLVNPAGVQREALEIACLAVQLPLRQTKTPVTGKLGRTNLRDRAEHAAEMLIGLLQGKMDDAQLDSTARILHEMPQRQPVLDEAKLLADAINLDDFSVTGVINQAVQLGLQGSGVKQLIEGLEKRAQYGYWDARSKEGFHFEPVRQMARKRLEGVRHLAAQLQAEAEEDARR